jgi:hypothetical protein
LRKAGAHAAAAVELLGRAKAAGLFDSPACRERLRTDADLAPLRARDDFKKLLSGLPDGPNPGKP